MKNFKQIQAMFLAVIMAVMTLGSTTAFAAESVAFEDTPIVSESSGAISPQSYEYTKFIDNVNITTTRSAAGRHTFGSEVTRFRATFSPVNGGDTIVAIRLHDTTLGNDRVIMEWQSSNGVIEANLNLSHGGTYIFEYLVARGSGTISVSNAVTAISYV